METGGRVRTERRLAAILAADVAGDLRNLAAYFAQLLGQVEDTTVLPTCIRCSFARPSMIPV